MFPLNVPLIKATCCSWLFLELCWQKGGWIKSNANLIGVPSLDQSVFLMSFWTIQKHFTNNIKMLEEAVAQAAELGLLILAWEIPGDLEMVHGRGWSLGRERDMIPPSRDTTQQGYDTTVGLWFLLDCMVYLESSFQSSSETDLSRIRSWGSRVWQFQIPPPSVCLPTTNNW